METHPTHVNLKKFQGALLGTFVGDALGMPVEGMDHDAILAKYEGPIRDMEPGRLRAGSYTDDTEMMIGLAEALADKGEVDCAVIGERFVDNFHAERGYGPATKKVIAELQKGAKWDEPGRKVYDGAGSFGNGAPMRIAPLGCFFFDRLDMIREAAEACSSITHTHPLGMEGGVVQALAVALAVGMDPVKRFAPVEFADILLNFTNKADYLKPLASVREFLKRKKRPEVHEVVKVVGNDVKAYTSCPAAIYSFLRNWASFELTVVYAVNLGGDTDTIGAMAGALAGGYHGVDAIPRRWLEALDNEGKGRDYVMELGKRLWETKSTKA
jgi:poly(ADP-ribose) glycohydrolase ARH3